MFEVKDKEGVSVNLKDEVTFTTIQTDMFKDGEEKEVDGIVVALLSEDMVQVQPEEGPAVSVMSDHLIVTSSLINMVESLCDSESMEKLILDAERRYDDECKTGVRASKSKGTSKPKVVKKQGSMKL